MISGIGVDIADVSRIARTVARHREKFLRYLYPESEIGRALGFAAERHAGVFAAKEAFAKALGCGFGKDCRWEEILISHDASGRPRIEVSGVTRRTFASRADKIHLSVSHEKNAAVAMAVLEKSEK